MNEKGRPCGRPLVLAALHRMAGMSGGMGARYGI